MSDHPGVPDLVPVEGTIRTIPVYTKYSPYSGSWWMTSYITRVPETAVGWLVAQGWQVTGTYQEEEDGQNYYTMSRQSMQNWMILQTLLNEYTQAYNEGREANAMRYNDVIDLWNNTIARTREQMDIQGDVSDAHITLYVTQLDELLTDTKDDVDAGLSAMQSASSLVSSQLSQMVSTANTLTGDHTTHAALARGFLTDLGTTELARINEKYDNLLAAMKQDLTNRGMYASAIVTQMTTRIERERNEEIGILNDRLNREKWENQHRLYEQQVRSKSLIIDSQGKYASLQLANGQFLTDTRRQLCLLRMQAQVQALQGRLDIRDREEKLMAYQLDTRNNLIVGLFGFMERREDSYPSMESVTKLVAGLGDAGGGWVTP